MKTMMNFNSKTGISKDLIQKIRIFNYHLSFPLINRLVLADISQSVKIL